MSPLPSYLRRSRTGKDMSNEHESRIADRIGGKKQRGSGAVDGHKGDVRAPELLIEAKMTSKESISIKKEWIIKISKEAAAYAKIPALAIAFDEMPVIADKDWIAIPMSFFKRLMEASFGPDDK